MNPQIYIYFEPVKVVSYFKALSQQVSSAFESRKSPTQIENPGVMPLELNTVEQNSTTSDTTVCIHAEKI